MKVSELTPGDTIKAFAGLQATYVAQTEHPIWPWLRLVVWRMPDGSWSHDALSPQQDVGEPQPSDREANLKAALLGPEVSRG